jgi:hypothetical protein
VNCLERLASLSLCKSLLDFWGGVGGNCAKVVCGNAGDVELVVELLTSKAAKSERSSGQRPQSLGGGLGGVISPESSAKLISEDVDDMLLRSILMFWFYSNSKIIKGIQSQGE